MNRQGTKRDGGRKTGLTGGAGTKKVDALAPHIAGSVTTDIAKTAVRPERHPLEPFFPPGAEILVLGSFPPPRTRWKMDFFYPNFQNDFWRIMGIVYFDDADRFMAGENKRDEIGGVGKEFGKNGVNEKESGKTGKGEKPRETRAKGFDLAGIQQFLTEKKIAIYDAAQAVVRERGNASDRFLTVTEPLDLAATLRRLPDCRKVILTGEKAAETIFPQLFPDRLTKGNRKGYNLPKPGEFRNWNFGGRVLEIHRVCSPSRAYPLPPAEKAKIYRRAFMENRDHSHQ